MLIMAIYFYVDASKAEDRFKTSTAKLQEVITDPVRNQMSEEISRLQSAKGDTARNPNGETTLFGMAVYQRNQLSNLISKTEDESLATTNAKAALDAAKKAGANASSLTDAVQMLISEVNASKAAEQAAKADSDASKKKLDDTLKTTGDQIATMQKENAQVRAEKDQLLEQIQKATNDQRQSFSDTTADFQKQLTARDTQISDLSSQNSALSKQVTDLKTLIQSLQEQLGMNRVDPNQAVLTTPDGQVLRVPSGQGVGKDVYIDLGQQDHVMKGLTFEVYDKSEGIPKLGDPSNDNDLPRGKASIQVISVSPTGSQCRIIAQMPGTTITEGDLIANLIYDKNTTYKFVVYGNFDLDQNGVATPQDAEVIKRLITQWGGQIQPEINVDTDFVVLGKEPVVPTERPNENDPIALAAYNKAVADADEYAGISLKAREFRLPILNQNRFLYMVGYFEMARR
jgi:hypothetical protein